MWIRVITARLWVFTLQGGTDKQDRRRSLINHLTLCGHVSVQCVDVFLLDREEGYSYECVRQRHKSRTGLRHRGEPHQSVDPQPSAPGLNCVIATLWQVFSQQDRCWNELAHKHVHYIYTDNHTHMDKCPLSSDANTQSQWPAGNLGQERIYLFVCLCFSSFIYSGCGGCWDEDGF